METGGTPRPTGPPPYVGGYGVGAFLVWGGGAASLRDRAVNNFIQHIFSEKSGFRQCACSVRGILSSC